MPDVPRHGENGFQPPDAVAFHLLVALERYERAIQEMAVRWPDMEGYHPDSVQLDDVRLHSLSLPSTSVSFVALLISRAELFQCLFEAGPQPDAAAVAACAADHTIAIAGLRRKCQHAMAVNH